MPPVDGLGSGSPGLCAAFGDPHFITFDGGHTVFVGAKLFWLVKSERVWVQGLSGDREGKLMGVAVGGPFLQGHSVVVRKVGPDALQASFDGEAILHESVDEFHQSGVVDGVREEKWQVGLHNDDVLKLRTERQFSVGPWPERFLGSPEGGVYLFRFPGDVELTLTGTDFMTLVLTMPAQPGGQGGYCGNFDGLAENDAEPVLPSWNRPIGPDLGPIAGSASLFGAGLADAGVEVRATPEAEAVQMFLGRLKNCSSGLREMALKRCHHVDDVRIREDCIFDVCMTGDMKVSDNSLAAEVMEQKVNSRGIPVFVGKGRCTDSLGRPYSSFKVDPTPPKQCPDILRSLALAEGVVGAQLNEPASTCEILVAHGAVDPRKVAVQGTWGAKERENAGGRGLVSGASGDPRWRCWQLD